MTDNLVAMQMVELVPVNTKDLEGSSSATEGHNTYHMEQMGIHMQFLLLTSNTL